MIEPLVFKLWGKHQGKLYDIGDINVLDVKRSKATRNL